MAPVYMAVLAANHCHVRMRVQAGSIPKEDKEDKAVLGDRAVSAGKAVLVGKAVFGDKVVLAGREA